MAFVFILWSGGFASLLLFNLYFRKPAGGKHSRILRWIEKFEISPEWLGGYSTVSLALISLLGLFLEMLLIRWVSSEIRIFAYFKNFVLIACFLGFGVGCSLCRRKINLLPSFLPLILLTIIVQLPWPGLRDILARLTSGLGAVSDVQMLGVPSIPFSYETLVIFFFALIIILPLFALLTLIFIPLGQLVAWYLEEAPAGIWAYSTNISASLAGILLFTFLSYLSQPPAVWFTVVGILFLIFSWRLTPCRWAILFVFLICISLLSLGKDEKSIIRWSPYQKLVLTPETDNGQLLAYHLTTNGNWYQLIIDLSEKFVQANRQLLHGVPIEYNAYNLPYLFYHNPGSVLVLGSGMGNDVAASLRNGAGKVVAVEIDPQIIDLGKHFHFEKPYDSPRVTVVIDDARSYIQRSQEKFDLIVFSLLDSQTTSSYYTNIRIDNYVYTIEALRAAKQLLKPDGVFIVKFYVETKWIAGRLQNLLTDVFGSPPLQIQSESQFTSPGRFFITGAPSKIQQAMASREVADYISRRSQIDMEKAALTTDDWPYFYQHWPGIPASIIALSIALGFFGWFLVRKTSDGQWELQWHFFFLGAAFMLLEVQIISKMALLFGTTWVVNSLVIGGLLLLILTANLLVSQMPGISSRMVYLGLFTSLMISYLIPIQFYFFESEVLKAIASTFVLCLPVFFAGIIFIRSFQNAQFAGTALGSNLMGSVLGGLLESFSLWIGIKSLVLIACCLYAASYLALRRRESPASIVESPHRSY